MAAVLVNMVFLINYPISIIKKIARRKGPPFFINLYGNPKFLKHRFRGYLSFKIEDSPVGVLGT